MQANNAVPRTSWRKSVVGGGLVLLSLTEICLPKTWAQLQYNGGFVQTHREDPKVLPRAAPQRGIPVASPILPPAFFPDNDFFYPNFAPATTSLTRSYYNARGEVGRPPMTLAGTRRYGIADAVLPWNQTGFKAYRDPLDPPHDFSLFTPRKYALEAVSLPQRPSASAATTAVLVVHLPEHALFWVEGVRTRSTGPTRYFESPSLRSGRKYSYTVRAAWIEDGRWVSERSNVPVEAGLIQAVYLAER